MNARAAAPMIAWLRHHVDRAERGVSFNALAHCHARNLHSIVLHDEPDNRIRMFFADDGHPLSSNRHGVFSLAIHPHHCAVRFAGLFGEVYNEVYAITPNTAGPFMEMAYCSAITQGEGSLTPTGMRATVDCIRSERLDSNPKLRAHEPHTIYAPCARSAWLVFEGEEDPTYQPRCWTNDPAPDLSGLYQPMDSERVGRLLAEVVRLIAMATA
jgi:hypothetical protein